MKNFDHAYRRRNLRQTLIFGFLLGFVAEQPLGDVYRSARRVPIEQAVAAAEQVRAIYADEAARDTTRSGLPTSSRRSPSPSRPISPAEARARPRLGNVWTAPGSGPTSAHRCTSSDVC